VEFENLVDLVRKAAGIAYKEDDVIVHRDDESLPSVTVCGISITPAEPPDYDPDQPDRVKPKPNWDIVVQVVYHNYPKEPDIIESEAVDLAIDTVDAVVTLIRTRADQIVEASIAVLETILEEQRFLEEKRLESQ